MGKNGEGTRERLLHVAAGQMASSGYHGVTMQGICSEAEANIAAVNYHFGSKVKLYLEVWNYAIGLLLEKYCDKGIEELPVEKRLEKYIDIRIASVLDESPAGWLPRIIHFEMNNPSEAHGEIFAHFMKPRIKKIRDLVHAYMGEDVDEVAAECATFSVMSQCIHINFVRDRKVWLFSGDGMDDVRKDQVRKELTTLIIGGVESYRTRVAGGAR